MEDRLGLHIFVKFLALKTIVGAQDIRYNFDIMIYRYKID